MPFMKLSEYSLPQGCVVKEHTYDKDLLTQPEKEIVTYLKLVENDKTSYSNVTDATDNQEQD